MKTYELEMFGNTYKIAIEYTNYNSNNSLAVILNNVYTDEFEDDEDTEEGSEPEVEEFAVLSVNLDASSRLKPNEAYIDENNLPNIGAWLVANGIAKPKGVSARSGWCSYPLYEFAKAE